MPKAYAVNDVVWCKYYNAMDKKWMGKPFKAVIVSDRGEPNRDFSVKRLDDGRVVTVWKKEILRRTYV
jgi:hypothetical protein